MHKLATYAAALALAAGGCSKKGGDHAAAAAPQTITTEAAKPAAANDAKADKPADRPLRDTRKVIAPASSISWSTTTTRRTPSSRRC